MTGAGRAQRNQEYRRVDGHHDRRHALHQPVTKAVMRAGDDALHHSRPAPDQQRQGNRQHQHRPTRSPGGLKLDADVKIQQQVTNTGKEMMEIGP
ncbi:MAG: hypothetical protein WDN04_17735 [Rhodospirillales bacterium]